MLLQEQRECFLIQIHSVRLVQDHQGRDASSGQERHRCTSDGGFGSQGHVLVTGGAGFIGSHATMLLLEKGYAVTIVDNLSRGNKVP
eukprot:jgi/Pico_ML_1/50555/g1743.t1